MQLGATVASATSDAVTHVVSGSDQTDKVHWARKQGRHVVSTGWLNAAGSAHTPSSSRLLWCAWPCSSLQIEYSIGETREPLSALYTLRPCDQEDHIDGAGTSTERK